MRTATSLLVLALGGCQNDYDILPGPVDVDPGDVTECGFTPISGTRMSSYDCNPVFTTTGEPWARTVDSVGFHVTKVLDHPFYQVWYSAYDASGHYGVGYAVSGDGTNWEASPDNPLIQAQAGAWDQDAMDTLQVVWDATGSRYVMAYQGLTLPTSAFDPGSWGFGIATSPDGVSWSKHPSNPVVNFVALAGTGIVPCWPLSLSTDNGSFSGLIGARVEGDPLASCDVYPVSATALDQWSMQRTPVLTGDQWYDDSGVAGASMVEYKGTKYLFYVGFEDWEDHGTYVSTLHHHLNLATSRDGVTWAKSPGNPIPISNTTEGDINAVGAQVIGSRIHLWVTDYYESEQSAAVGYFLFEPDIDPHP